MVTSRRATIADVAAQAGVGVGTVSRVLNGGANVREATRTKVLEVMGSLGYRPSHLATALSRGTPRTVAIVVPYLTRPSVVTRLAGALKVFDELGYDAVVCNVETPQQRDRHLQALVARHRADGVVVVSLPLAKRQLTIFEQAMVPLVMVDAEAAGAAEDGHRRRLWRAAGDRVPAVPGTSADRFCRRHGWPRQGRPRRRTGPGLLFVAAAAGRLSSCAARRGSRVRRGPGEVRPTRRGDGGGTRGAIARAPQAAVGDLRGL